MKMLEYDLAFSLGFSCGATQALRAAGLQFASYPLDWVGVPSLMTGVRTVVSEFDKWLEADDLKLWDVRHGPGFCTRIYRNERTGIGFSHEFSNFLPFAESYPKVCETYRRRADGFLERLKSSRRILAVYLELPFREAAPAADLEAALALLRGKCPAAEVELLYIVEDPACRIPVLRSERGGVRVLAADYRKFDGSEITHFVETGAIAAWLREHIRVADTRTAEDRARFEAEMKKNHDNRWGKGRIRSRLNQWAYKLYRSLERELQKRGLVQKEGPLWFVDK